MDRLEAVADVGQRPRHDDAHGVVEVARPHLVLDADGSDPAQVVGHGALVLRDGMGGARRGVRCCAGQERGRGGGGAGCGRGAGAAADAVQAGLDRSGRCGGELRDGVADYPGAPAVVRRPRRFGLSLEKVDDGGSICQHQGAKSP